MTSRYCYIDASFRQNQIYSSALSSRLSLSVSIFEPNLERRRSVDKAASSQHDHLRQSIPPPMQCLSRALHASLTTPIHNSAASIAPRPSHHFPLSSQRLLQQQHLMHDPAPTQSLVAFPDERWLIDVHHNTHSDAPGEAN